MNASTAGKKGRRYCIGCTQEHDGDDSIVEWGVACFIWVSGGRVLRGTTPRTGLGEKLHFAGWVYLCDATQASAPRCHLMALSQNKCKCACANIVGLSSGHPWSTVADPSMLQGGIQHASVAIPG